MLSFLIGISGVLISLVGWFGFKSILLLVIGTLFYVIETLLEWRNLNTGAKFVDIIVFCVGCIVAAIFKFPFYIGGMIAINCHSAITLLFSIPLFIQQVIFMFKLFHKHK